MNPQEEMFVDANNDEEHLENMYLTGYKNATKKNVLAAFIGK